MVSKRSFQIQACVDCGCHYTSPAPRASDIGPYYRSDAYISHTDRRRGLFEHAYHIVRRWAIKNKIGLLRGLRPQGHLLDLGAGTGAFAAAAAEAGYRVSAVEPSNAARSIAAQAQGVFIESSLEELPLEPHFDLVTMWHVLEHLYDPAETLQQIHQRMASDGRLIVAVPNRGSWDASHYGANWAAWDVPRHLTHFSHQNMVQLLTQCSFRLIRTQRMWFDAPYVSILSERGRGRSPLLASLLGLAIGTMSNTMALVTGRPTSSTIYLAEKAAGR